MAMPNRRAACAHWCLKYSRYASCCHPLRRSRGSVRTGPWCVLTRPKCYRLRGAGRRNTGSVVAAVVARGQVLVDLLAGGADRITLGVTAGHPDLAAKRGNRRAGHHAVDDLALVDVVREPLVIAVAVRRVRPHILLDAGLLVRKNLSLAHLGESISSGA